MNKRPGLDGQDWIAANEVDRVVAGLEAQLAQAQADNAGLVQVLRYLSNHGESEFKCPTCLEQLRHYINCKHHKACGPLYYDTDCKGCYILAQHAKAAGKMPICRECPHAQQYTQGIVLENYCDNGKRINPKWGKAPSWCPLLRKEALSHGTE